MNSLITFSGDVNVNAKRLCEKKLHQAYISLPLGTTLMCHISDRDIEYSGAMVVYLEGGQDFLAHSIANDPLDVLDDLIINIENQMKFVTEQTKDYREQLEAIPISVDTKQAVFEQDTEEDEDLYPNDPSLNRFESYQIVERILDKHYKSVILEYLTSQK